MGLWTMMYAIILRIPFNFPDKLQFVEALDSVRNLHARAMTKYKRLLEQAHGSSASQLHALQAELRILRVTLEDERAAARQFDLDRDHVQMQRSAVVFPTEDYDLAAALRGDGRGKFVEAEVRKAVRSLKPVDRMRL